MKILSFSLALVSIIFFVSCKKVDIPPYGKLSFELVDATQKSYIAVGNTGASKASYIGIQVVSAVDDVIDQFLFTSSGNGVKSVTVNGVTANFQAGIAKISNLNFTIKKGVATSYFFYVSYQGIGSATHSNDINSVKLVSVRTKKSYVDVAVDITSPTMKIVYSKPDSLNLRTGEPLIIGSGGYSGKYNFAIVDVWGNPKGGFGLNTISVKIFTGNVILKNITIVDNNGKELSPVISYDQGVTNITFTGGYGFAGKATFYLGSELDILIHESNDQSKVQIGTTLIRENPIAWTDLNGGSNVLQQGMEYYYGPIINSDVLVEGMFVY